MKTEPIEKLDEIIDSPNKHNTEEKLNIVVRVVRDIAGQVRGHYIDMANLKNNIVDIQEKIERLDNKLFGDRDNEGVIYSLTTQVKEINAGFTNFTRILWGVLSAIVMDIVLRFFNVI